MIIYELVLIQGDSKMTILFSNVKKAFKSGYEKLDACDEVYINEYCDLDGKFIKIGYPKKLGKPQK